MKKLTFFIMAYFVLLLIVFFVDSGCDNWNHLSTIAIILTGAILIWYTWEANLLRLESQRQTEIQLRPFVIIVPSLLGLHLKNIGNGTALNVSVEDVQVDTNFDVKIHFPDHTPVLMKDETTEAIRVEGYNNGKPAGDFFNAHLYPEYANRDLKLRIEFQNVESQAYFVEETVSPGKMNINGIQSRKTR